MISSVAIGIEEYSSRNMSSRGNESASGLDQLNLTCLQLDEMVPCRYEYGLKARKPYTITKQREKWTDEEHKRFVEALKLYGRAWRRIEEHLGTKTAVQIRSHAQKFFSKVGRESNANFIEPIEIPPPRPKRKPMHPYPRKLVIPHVEETMYMEVAGTKSISDEENQSPTSVLPLVGSDALGSAASNSPRSSSDEQCSLRNNMAPSEESNDEDSTRAVKLFGKTVFVTDCHISSSIGNVIEVKPIQPVARKFINGEISSRNSEFSWPSIIQAKETKLQRQKSSTGSNSGSVNYTGDVEDNPDVETQSSRCSLEIELIHVLEFRTSERSAFSQLRPKNLKKNKVRGFMPYKKRRVAEGEESKFSWIYPHKGLEPETSLCL